MEHVTVESVMAALAGLWAFVSLVVAITPTHRDDELLTAARRFLERLSFLQSKNSPGLLSLPGALSTRPLHYDPDTDAGGDKHERDGLP
jgi:hypothetical protein